MACDSCGERRGHLNGCDGGSSRRKADEAYAAAKKRQKEQAKLKNVGKPRSTEWMNAEIPEGHKSVKTGDGRYVIVKK